MELFGGVMCTIADGVRAGFRSVRCIVMVLIGGAVNVGGGTTKHTYVCVLSVFSLWAGSAVCGVRFAAAFLASVALRLAVAT